MFDHLVGVCYLQAQTVVAMAAGSTADGNHKMQPTQIAILATELAVLVGTGVGLGATHTAVHRQCTGSAEACVC
jgi:type II secretory pathway component PulF